MCEKLPEVQTAVGLQACARHAASCRAAERGEGGERGAIQNVQARQSALHLLELPGVYMQRAARPTPRLTCTAATRQPGTVHETWCVTTEGMAVRRTNAGHA